MLSSSNLICSRRCDSSSKLAMRKYSFANEANSLMSPATHVKAVVTSRRLLFLATRLNLTTLGAKAFSLHRAGSTTESPLLEVLRLVGALCR